MEGRGWCGQVSGGGWLVVLVVIVNVGETGRWCHCGHMRRSLGKERRGMVVGGGEM